MIELIELQDLNKLSFFIMIRVAIILLCWTLMVSSCLVDFWSGRSTARALGESINSQGFRRTVTKIGDYFKLLLFGLMFDSLGMLFPFYTLPLGSILCSIGCITIECTSVVENSRRKKAHVAEVPDIIKQIVQAATTDQGAKVLDKILSMNLTKQNHEENK